MVQHARHAKEVRHDADGHLFFRIKECHSQEESRHHGVAFYNYSKKHVDIAKGLIAPEEPKYYTIAEAMERFNLTRDQLYHYVKYHNIPRIKVGKYTKILRTELDKFFEPPKIE